MHMEEMVQEKAKKASKTLGDEEDEEYDGLPSHMETMDSAMEVENNNLLLKFDTMVKRPL